MVCNLTECYAMYLAVVTVHSEKTRLSGEPGGSDLPLVCMRMYLMSLVIYSTYYRLRWTYPLISTQVQIFLRGAQLTKIGGRIVYSTCSFNPIENESVVAEVLRLSNGALELLDMSQELKGLKRKPGMKTWKVSF